MWSDREEQSYQDGGLPCQPRVSRDCGRNPPIQASLPAIRVQGGGYFIDLRRLLREPTTANTAVTVGYEATG